MIENPLPAGFEDLAKYYPDWYHATERDRNRKRVNSSMAELKDYYDAFMPRIKEIAAYLDKFPIDAMPPREGNLLRLAMMAMEVAPAIEYLNVPDVPNAFPHERFDILPLPPRYRVAGE